MNDRIVIDSLELESRLGVPDDERAGSQRLTLSLVLEPRAAFNSLDDRIERAVDYAEVCLAAKEIAADRPRRLLETLAEDIAAELLRRFKIQSVELELRKYILPDTAFVAARLRRGW